MPRFFMIVSLLLFIVINPSNTFAQQFKLYNQALKSKYLKSPRAIYIFTPPQYLQQKNKKYPVIFFHDGQNLFDPQRSIFGVTWELEKTLNYLMKNKLMPQAIVVGIDNTPERIDEYTFSRDKLGEGGAADYYLHFITKELIPLLEKKFPISQDRALVGSSLGGLLNLYAAINFNTYFKRIAALSPSIWWDKLKILTLMQQATSLSPIIYIDSGTIGGERPQDVLDLEKILKRKWGNNIFLKTEITQGASHDEYSWSKRLPDVLRFLYQDHSQKTNVRNQRQLRNSNKRYN